MSQKLLHRGVFYTQKLLRAMATEIAVPKPDLGANTEKKNDFEALFRRKNKKEMDHRQIFFKQSDESPSQP
jgi:hypothetical protein